MKKWITSVKIFLIIAIPLAIYGIEPSILVSLTYQQYSLSDLRDFQSSLSKLLHQEGIPAKQFYRYPSQFVPEFRYQLRQHNRYQITMHYSYASTGSRIHYKDWSGEILFDQVISNNLLGLSLEMAIINKPVLLLGYLESSVLKSKLKSYENITTVLNSYSYSNTFQAYSFGFETGLVYELPFRFPLIRFRSGYLVTPPKVLKSISSKKRTDLELISPRLMRADWSGWRFGCDIGIVI